MLFGKIYLKKDFFDKKDKEKTFRTSSSNIKSPAVNVIIPVVNVIIPAVNIIIPVVNVIIPVVNIKIPVVNVIIPTVNVIIPTVNIIIPAVNVIIPTVYYNTNAKLLTYCSRPITTPNLQSKTQKTLNNQMLRVFSCSEDGS